MRLILQELIGPFQVANTVTEHLVDSTTITATGWDLEYIVMGAILILTMHFIYEFLLMFGRSMMNKGGKNG